MGSRRGGTTSSVAIVGLLNAMVLMWRTTFVVGDIDCSTVTALVYTCSNFISYGIPQPLPGSPCCDAIVSLNNLSVYSPDNRRSVCKCMMGLVTAYNPNATAIANLPSLCGISLGFTFDPTTDCNYIS